MKWLAIPTILSMLAMPAVAQTEGLVVIPTALYCGQTSSDNETRLKEQYGELPFLEGKGEVMSPNATLSYQGRVKMFLDPRDGSYSVFIELEGDLTCLVVTGEQIAPSRQGDDI